MDLLDELLDKLQEWFQKLLEALAGLAGSPEAEPVPIPVRSREGNR
jgi:hypothetical protein